GGHRSARLALAKRSEHEDSCASCVVTGALGWSQGVGCDYPGTRRQGNGGQATRGDCAPAASSRRRHSHADSGREEQPGPRSAEARDERTRTFARSACGQVLRGRAGEALTSPAAASPPSHNSHTEFGSGVTVTGAFEAFGAKSE